MKKIKKLTMTLALLLTAVTGAWAQTPGVKPLTVPDEWNGNDTEYLGINHLPKDFVATTEERAKALSCLNPDEATAYLIFGFDEGDVIKFVEFSNGKYNDVYETQYTPGELHYTSQLGSKWYYTTEPSIDVTPVTGQTNQWTFLMPGYNVLVTPIYEPEFAATFEAGNNLTIQGGKATLAVTEKDGTTAYTGATIDENGKFTPLYEGQTVTMTAAPGYKFRKVEVKEAVTYPLLSAATAEDIGKVVCADGHLHDAKTAVPDGCTAVGILGKVTETGHGLILALQDAAAQNWNTINGWTSETTYAGTTLKLLPDDAARGTNLTSYTTLGETTVLNWAVAQKDDYVAIFTNLGSTTGNNDGKVYDSNVNAYITGAGGAALSGDYWSATDGDWGARHCMTTWWGTEDKQVGINVRPVLGF